jgi:ribosomal protein L23
MSTAISIKHRILATFNIKTNSILTACMPEENAHMAQTKTLTDSTRKRHKKEDSASFV